MPDELSVRQWQEKFRAGAFSTPDRYTQCEAGWYDWFCRDEALAGRLKKIGRVVMGITDPFILDNYYVWFKNNCPMSGPLYDDVRFEPLSGERDGKYFVISLDSPHERMKWALTTERFGFSTPEFECKNIREMIQYVNKLGPELEQGFMPSFVAEKRAVEIYAKIYGEPSGIYVYREGDHRYSYTSFQDRQKRNVMAVASLEETPAGFVAEQAEEIKGIHVYCPENAGKSPPSLEEAFADTHPERQKKGGGAMTNNNKPLLPPEAEAEIMDRLSANMRISSEEIAAILAKHGVSGDVEALQNAYRKRVGQRLMASIRDENGRREVLAHGSEYVVVECCNDQQALKIIHRRINGQISGLNTSADKVQGRIGVLGRFLARFRKAG